MKYIKRIIIITMCIMLLLVNANTSKVYAKSSAPKSKVTYTLKKGVLTIKGKGKMPETMTFKNNKKIKKVVIGDQITSISGKAFYNCKNLKSVKIGKSVVRIGYYSFYGTSIKNLTIPKNVKVIGEGAFITKKKMDKVKMPGSIIGDSWETGSVSIFYGAKTIEFTTNLELDTVFMAKADKYVVSKKDPNYDTDNGIIYTEKLKKVVHVPNRKKIVIADGCEIFDLSSVGYGFSDDGTHLPYMTMAEEIILPKTVTAVECEGWWSFNLPKKLKTITFLNKDIDEKYIKLIEDCIDNDGQGSIKYDDGVVTIGKYEVK